MHNLPSLVPQNYYTIMGMQMKENLNNEIFLKQRCSKLPSKGNNSSIHNLPTRRLVNYLQAWSITLEKMAAFLVWIFKKGSLVMPGFLMLHLSHQWSCSLMQAYSTTLSLYWCMKYFLLLPLNQEESVWARNLYINSKLHRNWREKI